MTYAAVIDTSAATRDAVSPARSCRCPFRGRCAICRTEAVAETRDERSRIDAVSGLNPVQADAGVPLVIQLPRRLGAGEPSPVVGVGITVRVVGVNGIVTIVRAEPEPELRPAGQRCDLLSQLGCLLVAMMSPDMAFI